MNHRGGRAVGARWLRGALVLALLPLGAGSLGGPARAQVAGPNGLIAFSFSDECCDWDIWVMNPDGTGQTNLTNTPEANEVDPSWSPDGTKIAYTREEDVWVMNADGSEQTNLTQTLAWDFGADWSPDGSQLVFVRHVPGEIISEQFDIHTMNADGTEVTNITTSDTDELDPAWSPDGSRIAIAGVRQTDPSGGGDWEIVTMNTDGTSEEILTVEAQEDRGPAWSPDSTQIAWMSAFDSPCCGDWEIWAMNADGSGGANLTNHPAGDVEPAWSPDGTMLTFLSNRDSIFTFDVYTMEAPSTLPPPSPRTAAAAEGDPVRLTSNGHTEDPNWGTAEAVSMFDLTVTKRGAGHGKVRSSDGTIRCGSDCSHTYPALSEVTLRAKARRGSVFVRWRGACSGKSPTCVVVMDGNEAVRARFRLA